MRVKIGVHHEAGMVCVVQCMYVAIVAIMGLSLICNRVSIELTIAHEMLWCCELSEDGCALAYVTDG